MQKPYRSFFWPVILIGVGVVWLLANLNIIPEQNLAVLFSLWPLILIVIGLDVLFGRNSRIGGAIIGLLAIAAIIFALIAGPALGLPVAGTLKTRTIEEPIGEALSADVTLNLSSQPVTITALENSKNILEAEIDYFGGLNYSATGNPTRRIKLERVSDSAGVNFGLYSDASWDIALTPDLPMDLSIDGASGSNNLDLSSLRLTRFWMDQGSGSATLSLPASTQAYEAEIIGGSGSLNLSLPVDGEITVQLDGGSGSITIKLPENAAVRVDARDDGSGSLTVGKTLQRVSSRGDDDTGVWETPGFKDSGPRLVIIIEDAGSGSITIR